MPRKRKSYNKRKRATRIEKLERYAIIVALMGQRLSRADIVLFIMKKYDVGRAMAYRYFEKATDFAMKTIGGAEMKFLFLEHVQSLRDDIVKARKSEQFMAVASLEGHLGEVLGFSGRRNEGGVNVNILNNQQQAQLPGVTSSSPEDTSQGSMLQRLGRMSHDQLVGYVSGTDGRAGRKLPAPESDGLEDITAEDIVCDPLPPEHEGGAS